MFRLMAYNRMKADIPVDVMSYTCVDNDGFPTPIMDNLLDFAVTVTTCSMAGCMYNLGVPSGHYDVVLIDECGQCIEPEAVSAFAWNLKTNGQLILAGDPKQLGPIVNSPICRRNGLSKSLLSRLMEHPVYAKSEIVNNNHGYDPHVLTKLTICYRCHEHILHVPNELFYDNELESQAAVDDVIQHLDVKFPTVFHSVIGQDLRESNSPSYFNIDEPQIVKHYVDLLIHAKVSVSDIGVIAPYLKQVQKLRKIVPDGITVGTCERFQGQERRVIIISTVRSSRGPLSSDVRHNLGFVSQPQRFNVAVTRAKSMLVVIGNPVILRSDNCWKRCIEYCQSQSSLIEPVDNDVLK